MTPLITARGRLSYFAPIFGSPELGRLRGKAARAADAAISSATSHLEHKRLFDEAARPNAAVKEKIEAGDDPSKEQKK